MHRFTIWVKCDIIVIAGLHFKSVLWKCFLHLPTNSSPLVSSTIPENIYPFRVNKGNIKK